MKKSTVIRIVFCITWLVVILSFYLFSNIGKRMYTVTYTDYLDTVCEITTVSKSDDILKICEEYLQFAEKEFSAEDEESTLYKLNAMQNVSISPDLEEMISKGAELTNKFPNYFSIYLDDLIKTWNISGQPTTIPSQENINNSLTSEKINLGGIAKGYITDKLVEKFVENNIKTALINLGGNTYALGKKPTGENWKVGIQNPKNENGLVGAISAENIAVITSGDYQRFVIINNKKYHHIFNPETGYPSDNGVHSVTVIHKSATMADILSTTAFVAGVENGNNILKEYGAMGIFITDDTVYYSEGIKDSFQPMDSSYKYELLH